MCILYDPSYFCKIINILQILKGVCKVLTSTVCMHVQTRFQKSWDTVQIVNKKGMQ